MDDNCWRLRANPVPDLRSSLCTRFAEQGGRRILIDSGCGRLFGPALGNVPDKLEAAGVTASRVDTVVLTHMHPDHIGGSGARKRRTALRQCGASSD
ncbi:MBL fold metallo-hydrolase [Caballeronia sp. LZ001]|uniref:MBL fold metallo-hydrolase n=1 Tax=Caballeronia sp. LZ001 TaxID=3038553 RepID=UPI0038D4653B